MKSFIFVQWKNPTDASRFVIDGEVSCYLGTELQDAIMRIISDVPKFREIRSGKNRTDLSPSFRCSKKYCTNIKSFVNFIEGNFEETDCSGRKLVYIFATVENEPERIVQILSEYASLLEVTPHSEDMEEIQKVEFKQNNKIILCVTIIAIVFLLLFMWLNHLSKQ